MRNFAGLIVLGVLLCLLQWSDGANILFFFAGGTYSHKVGIWPLITSLGAKGHNVTFLSSYSKQPAPAPGVHDVVPKALANYLKNAYKIDRLALRRAGRAMDFWSFPNELAMNICNILLENEDKDPVLEELIYRAKFDLLVINMVGGDCGYVLNHQYKTKIITSLSSFTLPFYPDIYGFPGESSWVPEVIGIHNYPMTFFGRVYNFILPFVTSLHWRPAVYRTLEGLIRKTYKVEEVSPSVAEMEKNISLMLINNHYGTTDFARSFPPMVIPIGGMQAWLPHKNLSQEFQEYLDDAKEGAILFTFGSSIDLNTVPEFFTQIMFNLFRKFPHIRFLFKWDGDLPRDAPKNIKPAKWLPQFEILSHPNVKAFISHAGSNSLTEAVYHGVPVVLMPLFADQDYNGYVVQAKRLGIRLEAEFLTSKIMEDAVGEVLNNPEYRQNMKRAAKIFRDRPVDPIQSATYWTEFVLRHESTESLKPLVPLNMFQHRMYDVILFLFSLFLLLLAAIGWTLKKLLRCFSRGGCCPAGASGGKEKRN